MSNPMNAAEDFPRPMSCATSEPEATADERTGMDWWHGLSQSERREWLEICGGASVADAWAFHKATAPRASQILAEQRAAEQRVIAENRPQWNGAEYFAADDLRILRPSTGEMAVVAEGSECGLPVSVRIVRGDSAQDIYDQRGTGLTTDDSAEIAAIVDEIDQDPYRFAARHAALERRVGALELSAGRRQ